MESSLSVASQQSDLWVTNTIEKLHIADCLGAAPLKAALNAPSHSLRTAPARKDKIEGEVKGEIATSAFGLLAMTSKERKVLTVLTFNEATQRSLKVFRGLFIVNVSHLP